MCKDPIKHLEEFQSNQEWFMLHFDEILEKYNGRFVAVLNESILATNEDLITLRDEISKKKNARAVYVEYVTDKPPELIL